MEFLFRHRGEGKRQVKPSQDIALLEDQIAGESSDDSDFVMDDKHNASDHSGASTEDSDSSSSSSDDDSMQDEAESLKKVK